MTTNIITAAALIIALEFQTAALSSAPQSGQDRRPPTTEVFPGSRASEQEGSGLPDEMRSRLRIERDEIEHKKILNSAKQLGELSLDVHRSYRERGKLASDDVKKLSTIEKLAKRILSHAGGEEFELKDKSAAPPTVSDAVNRLLVAASDVKEKITAETRFVVSTAVIEVSNEVIRLAQFIRRAKK